MILDMPSRDTTVWVEREVRPSSQASPIRRIKKRQAAPNHFFSTVTDDPGWFLPTVNAMEGLLALPANWDSYGAPKIDPEIVKAALSFLQLVMSQDSPAPAVVPTSGGGIQVEWHNNTMDLEVEFISPSRISGSFEDLNTGERWERDLSVDLQPLVQAINQISI